MSHSIPYVIQSKGEFESMKIDSNQTIKDIKKPEGHSLNIMMGVQQYHPVTILKQTLN